MTNPFFGDNVKQRRNLSRLDVAINMASQLCNVGDKF